MSNELGVGLMDAPENTLWDKGKVIKPLQFCAVASLRPKRRGKIQLGPPQELVFEPLPTPIVAKQGRPLRLHRSHPPLQIWRSPSLETRSIPPAKSRITPILYELTDWLARASASFSLAQLRHAP